MAAIQPIDVKINVSGTQTCVRCKAVILCEACGLAPAAHFGIVTITDELREIPHDVCSRCFRVWDIAPEHRVPADAQAAEWSDMTNRNVGRAYPPRKTAQVGA